ncbi:MAG: DUF503 domain-containing protein [Candidatus Omnitrophica bacterium]|nr:DUF503 domain-containing protein [Candidatus Omnitrophota bacterium]
MVIGVLVVDLHLPANHSLKEKRRVLKSLKDQLHHRFNVSVAEVDGHDLWQRAALAVTSVGTDQRYLNGQLSKIVDWIRGSRSVELLDHELEFL